MTDRDEEAARLRAVYERYGQDDAVRSRWGDSPGNRLMLEERDAAVAGLLRKAGWLPYRGGRVLEVGCGAGRNLALLASLGVPVTALHGVDLMPDRVAQARARLPGAWIECADATALPFEAGEFEVVLLFTVMSSILDRGVAERLAAEVRRVVRPGSPGAGGVVWYDMRFDNPRNPNIRGIGRVELGALFPGYAQASLRTLTLLPPAARALGRVAPWLYRPLAAVPLLRSHYLGLLVPGRGG